MRFLFIAFMLLTACKSHRDNSQNTAHSDDPYNTKPYVISQGFVKDYLLSPSSADFPIEARVGVKGVNNYVIESTVDFKNAYGTVITEKYLCELTFKGGEWEHKDNWTLDFLKIGDDVMAFNEKKVMKNAGAKPKHGKHK